MITDIDKQTALILIDLQNAIVNAQLAHPVAEILKNANKLCDVFRDKKLPVIIVNVNPQSAPWTKSRKDSKTSPIPQDDEWC